MARGRSSYNKGSVGTMGTRSVNMKTTIGRALPAKNGGSGKPSTSMSPWKGGGRSKPGI